MKVNIQSIYLKHADAVIITTSGVFELKLPYITFRQIVEDIEKKRSEAGEIIQIVGPGIITPKPKGM